MPVLSNYGGINAKVKALRGKLLSYEDYFSLTQYKSLPDFGAKLKEFREYEKAISSIDESNMRRAIMEDSIKTSVSDEFMRIYNFVSDKHLKQYLEIYLVKREIEILKLLLCDVYDERGIQYDLPYISPLLKRKLKIDIPRLRVIKNVDEFIHNLQDTPYYNVLKIKYEDEQPTLFELEMELDLYYYNQLWSYQEKFLDKANKKVMREINGTEIDLRNITWIYRFKIYYNINDATIYSNLIPKKYKLTTEKITQMVEAPTTEALLSEIANSPYKEIISQDYPLDKGCYRLMSKIYRKAQKLYPNTLSITVAYIYYKEMEINNIISLLEGTRYSYDQSKMLDNLILRSG